MLKTFEVIVNQFSNMHLRTNHKDKMDIRTSLAFNDLNLSSMGTDTTVTSMLVTDVVNQMGW